MNERVWERVERSRERWDVLNHPFYKRWSAGELSGEELARYSGQYRHAVEAIAAMTSAVADVLPGRGELRAHASEEAAHVRLWDGFVEASGGGPDDAPTPETAECVRAWTADAEVAETLMRLYAIESGQPEISRTKREGLLGSYGFADGTGTAYFRVHESRDVEHAAEVRELVAEVASEGDEDALVAAAEAAFRANWRLLDGVSGMSRGDRLLGIVLGIVVGLAILAVFVFLFSEDTVDAPSIDEAAPTEQPAEREQPQP